MKKLLILLLCAGILWACDPFTSTTFIVNNQTAVDATMKFYPDSLLEESFHLPSQEKTPILHVEDDPGDGPAQTDFRDVDSIMVLFDDERRIVYYPDDSTLPSGKTIYGDKYQKEKKDGNHYDITFTITEDDLENAQD